MKIKPILIGLILLAFLSIPVLAADNHDGPGEENVTLTQKDGSVINPGSKSIEIEKSDSSESDKDEDTSKSDSSNSDEIDVWGIQQSDMSGANYADLGLLTRIYSGITPLRNISLLGIAIAFGLSFTSVLAAAFILVFLAAVGGLHPNVKKGMGLITGSRGRLLGVFGVFFLALFMIVLTFFFLAIFNKLSLFVA